MQGRQNKVWEELAGKADVCTEGETARGKEG